MRLEVLLTMSLWLGGCDAARPDATAPGTSSQFAEQSATNASRAVLESARREQAIRAAAEQASRNGRPISDAKGADK